MMDQLWTIILGGLHQIQAALFFLFSPLHGFGPGATIAVIAGLTVLFAKTFTRRFKTRRYRELEKEFAHWYGIKQEALKLRAENPEKARQLGVNIDKGKLNEVYYNYFFEGLLNNLLTMYIPIVSMLGFVNDTYRPEVLESLFGQPHLFLLPWLNGKSYPVGAAFWFVICVTAAYLGWFAIGLAVKKRGGAGGGKTGDQAAGLRDCGACSEV